VPEPNALRCLARKWRWKVEETRIYHITTTPRARPTQDTWHATEQVTQCDDGALNCHWLGNGGRTGGQHARLSTVSSPDPLPGRGVQLSNTAPATSSDHTPFVRVSTPEFLHEPRNCDLTRPHGLIRRVNDNRSFHGHIILRCSRSLLVTYQGYMLS
jgi:hypothetical protein